MKIAPNKREFLSELDEDVLVLDPDSFDAAIVGLVSRIDRPAVVCYSVEKILEVLMEDGMDEEEAREYYEFNILGAYVGEATPMFLEDLPI
jgi:hypothetical protein